MIKMLKKYRHISFWLCSMMLLLCQACDSSSEETPGEDPGVKEPSQLEINVYTPGHPVVTRAEKVDPDTDEKEVKSLQIWVFVSEAKSSEAGTLPVGYLVGYLSPQITTPSSTDFVGKYQLTVSDLFTTLRPKVNVYVVANVGPSNTGYSLTASSTMVELENALIHQVNEVDYFGLSSPMMTAVPEDGLPMSGVLIDTDVVGSQPVLKVQTPVTVVRSISKVRFLFSRTKQQTEFGEDQDLKIVRITINNGMIPKAEYLFLNRNYSEDGSWPNYNPVKSNPEVESDYESGTDDGGQGIALSPLAEAASQIPEYENPSAYAYTGEVTGQDYENLINTGIEEGHLAEIGKFYIRESDKQVTGRIHYTIGNDATVKSSTFRMTRAGEFSRNHTWIVYGYFSAKELLSISSVNVLPWTTTYTDYVVPNW